LAFRRQAPWEGRCISLWRERSGGNRGGGIENRNCKLVTWGTITANIGKGKARGVPPRASLSKKAKKKSKKKSQKPRTRKKNDPVKKKAHTTRKSCFLIDPPPDTLKSLGWGKKPIFLRSMKLGAFAQNWKREKRRTGELKAGLRTENARKKGKLLLGLLCDKFGIRKGGPRPTSNWEGEGR